MANETKLIGGRSSEGVGLIDGQVHRNLIPNSDFVHQLLLLLDRNNFNNAPKFLGIDEKNREILTYIDGQVQNGVEV